MSFGPKSVLGVENSLKNGQKENPEAFDFQRFPGCGGRNRTRTCDPIDVNDVLYQLSHATVFFLMTLPSTSNIMPQTSEFVNRKISKNYFSCATLPSIRNGKGKKKENKRPECQKSGGAGGTAATQSSQGLLP